jgi:hypothetical protein
LGFYYPSAILTKQDMFEKTSLRNVNVYFLHRGNSPGFGNIRFYVQTVIQL